MRSNYQARRISKGRVAALRRSGAFRQSVLLDSYTGLIVVEPRGSDLGDGEVLPPEVADAELSSAWCLDPQTKIQRARQLLGLDALAKNGSLVEAGV
jgi:hypothetical protein